MLGAGISVNGKTDLYVIESGTLTALRYCNEILDQFANATGQEFILMDNNASPNRAHITNVHLECETIVCMDSSMNMRAHISVCDFSQTCATQDFTGAQGCVSC